MPETIAPTISQIAPQRGLRKKTIAAGRAENGPVRTIAQR
jgi:hypothetical protein